MLAAEKLSLCHPSTSLAAAHLAGMERSRPAFVRVWTNDRDTPQTPLLSLPPVGPLLQGHAEGQGGEREVASAGEEKGCRNG